MAEHDIVRAFFSAAGRGDVESVEALLHEDATLATVPDSECFNYRLLNYGAWKNSRAFVDLALDHGATVDEKCEFWAGDWTALQHAVNYGNIEIAEYLLERGARLDAHAASGLSRVDDLKSMLSRDRSLVGEKGGDGTLPLHFAADPEVAQLLLDHGAEVDARDIDHFSTAAQWAVERRAEVSRFLVHRGAEPDIFMAVCSGDVDWVGQMLQQDPGTLFERVTRERFEPPDGQDLYCIYTFCSTIGLDATPLHVAAKRNLPDVIDLLLDAGLGVDIRGAYDEGTPLHFAAWHDNPEAVNRLLDRGASIDQRSGEIHRNTPLGWGIVAGSVGAVRLLLERGAQQEGHHVKDARAGVQGEFREYSSAPRQAYRTILSMLRNGRSGVH